MKRPQTFLQNVGACVMHFASHRNRFLVPKPWIKGSIFLQGTDFMALNTACVEEIEQLCDEALR